VRRWELKPIPVTPIAAMAMAARIAGDIASQCEYPIGRPRVSRKIPSDPAKMACTMATSQVRSFQQRSQRHSPTAMMAMTMGMASSEIASHTAIASPASHPPLRASRAISAFTASNPNTICQP